MLGQASAWQNPEPMYAGGTWSDLKVQVPYLTIRVPSNLVTMLDKAEALNSEINLYLTSVSEVVGSLTRPDNPSIGIVTATASYGPIFDVFHLAISLWKSKKPLSGYFREYMKKNRPDVENWHLELHLDGKMIDQPAGIQAYVDRILAALEAKPQALKVQASFLELERLAGKIADLITKELGKPMAPAN